MCKWGVAKNPARRDLSDGVSLPTIARGGGVAPCMDKAETERRLGTPLDMRDGRGWRQLAGRGRGRGSQNTKLSYCLFGQHTRATCAEESHMCPIITALPYILNAIHYFIV